MKVLIFFIAFILGGMAGIVTMCLVQINRESEAQLEKFLNRKTKRRRKKNAEKHHKAISF